MLLYLKAVSALYIAGYASQVLPEITPPPPFPPPPPPQHKRNTAAERGQQGYREEEL